MEVSQYHLMKACRASAATGAAQGDDATVVSEGDECAGSALDN